MRTKWLAVWITAFALGCVLPAQAIVFSWAQGVDGVTFANGGVVPDYNSGPGQWSDTRSISSFDSGFTIQDVNVTLNISGGYNGDLYVFLRYTPVGGGDTLAVLLNRIGRTSGNTFGSSGAGMNVTLDDGGNDIHLAGNGVLSGTYSPDARTADPATVFDTDDRSAFLSSFNGLNANGEWSLFVADMSGGDQSQLVSWGLDITAVPEPVNLALAIFGIGAVGFCVCSPRRAKRLMRQIVDGPKFF
jgi:subtilisin-like proprotein convertase family protein